jgi:tetratricopeptide (TPR) repeat protein
MRTEYTVGCADFANAPGICDTFSREGRRAVKTFAFVVLLAFAANAQPRHKLVVNSDTEEGKLLQQIGQQTDDPKKQALLEEFIAKYPKHDGVTWVYGQLQPLYIKQNQFDKALDAGDKALAIDPDDLDVSYNNLKAAEGKKDPDPIKKWALQTSQIARKTISAAKPGNEDDKNRADYARQVDTYCEYSLYATALQSTDVNKTLELVEALEQLNPRSQYLPKVYGNYLSALRQSGQVDKAGSTAEKLADNGLANEDVLLIAADYNLQKKNQPDKVILYSTKLLDLLNSNALKSKAKPEGVSDADWEKKQQTLSGLAYWMAGITYSGQGKYAEADKSLRDALPNLKDEQVRAIALFHLGLADYQLGKAGKNRAQIQDALKYSEQSAAIASPLQAQAQKNVRAIRGELGGK